MISCRNAGNIFVFQRRRDGSENFRRNWTNYAKGFGKLNNEFWLGLETIHQLTKNANYELRIDLGDFEGNTTYAKYGIFNIASGNDKYRLEVGDHSGPIQDEMVHHNKMTFTTQDSDNVGFTGNCALVRKGAWWFDNGCGYLNLNGIYYKDGRIDNTGIYWWYWKGNFHSLKFTEMKLRKKT
uniref:ryncolin-1-like n=1 Tax=Styela clava TaxID=7725 RepID=UPI00193A33EF|nr:ryncolin-1-like [Styela clava]